MTKRKTPMFIERAPLTGGYHDPDDLRAVGPKGTPYEGVTLRILAYRMKLMPGNPLRVVIQAMEGDTVITDEIKAWQTTPEGFQEYLEESRASGWTITDRIPKTERKPRRKKKP